LKGLRAEEQEQFKICHLSSAESGKTSQHVF